MSANSLRPLGCISLGPIGIGCSCSSTGLKLDLCLQQEECCSPVPTFWPIHLRAVWTAVTSEDWGQKAVLSLFTPWRCISWVWVLQVPIIFSCAYVQEFLLQIHFQKKYIENSWSEDTEKKKKALIDIFFLSGTLLIRFQLSSVHVWIVLLTSMVRKELFQLLSISTVRFIEKGTFSFRCSLYKHGGPQCLVCSFQSWVIWEKDKTYCSKQK